MGETTGISWTDATWNPWMGCTRVSPGCDGCYMFREQRQYGNDPTVVRRSKTKFNAPLKFDEPKLVFTCSWSDWFHVDADPWRDEAWDVIRRTPQHTYQILTKRPGRIHRCLPADWGDGYPNVWLGVSVESSEFLNRVGVLREIPASLRFISAEPLLGSLYDPGSAERVGNGSLDLDGIGWVIVGGESGPRKPSGDIPPARPMHPDWARQIRDAALELGDDRPRLHMKQWGSWTPDPFGGHTGDVYWVGVGGETYTGIELDMHGIDDNALRLTRMRYAGPHPSAGGKELDGVDWCEIPERTLPGQLTLA